MKLGAITDGISRNLEEALQIMAKDGLKYPELQWVWNKEIGDHSIEELNKIKKLVDKYKMKISVLSRHLFMGLPTMTTEKNSPEYKEQYCQLIRTIKTAQYLKVDKIRAMSFSKIANIWGYNGADSDMAADNKAWNRFLKLYEPIVQAAEDNKITIVIETAVNAMAFSGYLAKKMIKDLGSSRLKVLWDPGNTICNGDLPFPEAYEEIKDVLGHVHIKDLKVRQNHGKVWSCPIGKGDMAEYWEKIAFALKRDEYDGVVSMELMYRPEGGDLKEGYFEQVNQFKKFFA
jgi:sugar phosphate isomerase/epimerase